MNENNQEQILHELKEIKALTAKMAVVMCNLYEENWKAARWVGWTALQPYLDKKSKLTIYDILPLPGDPVKEN